MENVYMGSFDSPLILEATGHSVGKRALYRVKEKFSYEVGGKGSGIFIDVPVGFYTDFASVPCCLTSIFPPDGQHGKAAVIHDYMYRKRCKFSRILADAIFLDAMRSLKVPLWKRYTMYLAVRVFGWMSFNKRN